VTSETPAAKTTGVAVTTNPTATFNEAVRASTISFTLKNSSGSSIGASVVYNSSTNTATLTPFAALAESTTYTATVSGAKDTAGDSMSGPVSWSFTTDAPVVVAPTGTTFYVSPSTTSGNGTLSDPFGVSQLLNTTGDPFTQGPALTILQPGDTLYFLAGTYDIAGNTDPGVWSYQLLSPTVSGTPTAPITLSAYPGATVNIVVTAGVQPAFGTETPALSYVRFIGFTVNPGPDSAFQIDGTGDEVAYNKVVGQYVATIDNHDGIRIDNANATWVHNNIITGVTGEGANSAGIKVYYSTNLLITDNYIYGNTTGIHDKDGGTLGNGTNQNTYARNWITNNSGDQFLGNNQNDLATYYMYDNVIGGDLNLEALNTGSQIYNNLLITSNVGDGGRITGIGTEATTYQENVWNNITIANNQPLWGYDADEPLSVGGSTSPLSYMDYNVYDSTPEYYFNSTYTLAQMQSDGFENHAYVVSGLSSLYQNETSWVLLPQWTTAGRYGDPVGPRYPVAQIMNTSRYGPGALTTGTAPSITQQPQNQKVASGGSATFSVQASGSGLLYQWMTSNNGGSTWAVVQGATSSAYTIAQVSSADNSAVFRCLVSNVGGSAWSNLATITVTTGSDAIVRQSSVGTAMAAPTVALGVVANGSVSAAATPALTYSIQTVLASPVAAQTDAVDPSSSPAFVQPVDPRPAHPPVRAKTRPGQISRHRVVPLIKAESAHPSPSRVRWAKELRSTHRFEG
jgi:Bacterial Ig-like domain